VRSTRLMVVRWTPSICPKNSCVSSRHERFKDRLLGVLRSAPWWCRRKSKSALSKKI
jgi:hypothetical protein